MAKTKKKAAKKIGGAKRTPAAKLRSRSSVRAFRPTPGLEAGKGPNPKRVRIILEKLQEAYPDAVCELKHQNAF